MADGFEYETVAQQAPRKVAKPDMEAYMIPLPEADRVSVR